MEMLGEEKCCRRAEWEMVKGMKRRGVEARPKAEEGGVLLVYILLIPVAKQRYRTQIVAATNSYHNNYSKLNKKLIFFFIAKTT